MQAYLENIVKQFAKPGFRRVGNTHWNQCMQDIEQEIKLLGFSPKVQVWQNESGIECKNFIVSIEGKNPETYILGGHYDTYEETPGADDNASAVAVLLGVLKQLDKQKTLDHTWEIVFYSSEEPPYFGGPDMGSFKHASTVDKSLIKCMICLEMVGYFSEEAKSQDYPFFPLRWIYGNRGNFLLGVSNATSRKEGKKIMEVLQQRNKNFYKKLFLPFNFSGLDWSDHRNYWAIGIPALMITDTAMFRNKNYHQAEDTFNTLNYAKMSLLVKDLVFLMEN